MTRRKEVPRLSCLTCGEVYEGSRGQAGVNLMGKEPTVYPTTIKRAAKGSGISWIVSWLEGGGETGNEGSLTLYTEKEEKGKGPGGQEAGEGNGSPCLGALVCTTRKNGPHIQAVLQLEKRAR